MRKRLLIDIEKNLRSQRSALLQDVAETDDDDAVIAMERESELEELAQKHQLFYLSERLTSRNRRLMQEIDSALQRLANGKYGFCAFCDEEIAAERLRALPTATLCIECASNRERRLRAAGNNEMEDLSFNPAPGSEMEKEFDSDRLAK